MLIDVQSLASAIFDDLQRIAQTAPNERLPKEEQTRSCIYAVLRDCFDAVCVERGYRSIDDGARTECDILATRANASPTWIEIKHCWSASGWVNKHREQCDSWTSDLCKLADVPSNSDRYFLLVGFFGDDPLANAGERSLSRSILGLDPTHLTHRQAVPFLWRKDDGIAYVSIWIWHWGYDEAIGALRVKP